MSIDEAVILLTNLARHKETTYLERDALSLGVSALIKAKTQKAMA